MGKKAWIIFTVLVVVIVAIALVLMLVLIPQQEASTVQAGTYEAVAKQEYTFSGANMDAVQQQYNITADDVSKGLKTNKFEEGNINPFTPKADITVYNEPTKENDNQLQKALEILLLQK